MWKKRTAENALLVKFHIAYPRIMEADTGTLHRHQNMLIQVLRSISRSSQVYGIHNFHRPVKVRWNRERAPQVALKHGRRHLDKNFLSYNSKPQSLPWFTTCSHFDIQNYFLLFRLIFLIHILSGELGREIWKKINFFVEFKTSISNTHCTYYEETETSTQKWQPKSIVIFNT